MEPEVFTFSTKARHLIQPWAIWIQSTPSPCFSPRHICNINYCLIYVLISRAISSLYCFQPIFLCAFLVSFMRASITCCVYKSAVIFRRWKCHGENHKACGQWEKHEGVSTTGSPYQPSDKSDATVSPSPFLYTLLCPREKMQASRTILSSHEGLGTNPNL